MTHKMCGLVCLVSLFSWSCTTESDTVEPPTDSMPPLQVELNFDQGNYDPLIYTTGRTDSPADADPAYSAGVENQQLVYRIPTSPLRPKLSGFLDLPSDQVPIAGEMIHDFTFTDVSELLALAPNNGELGIAGCYIRGAIDGTLGPDWTNGDNFGGFWFGFVKMPDGAQQTVIRSGANNLVSEPFSANNTVTYRIHKDGSTLELLRKYDAATEWTSVGSIELQIRQGGSPDVMITHVRVLNNSEQAIAVTADDFLWYYN